MSPEKRWGIWIGVAALAGVAIFGGVIALALSTDPRAFAMLGEGSQLAIFSWLAGAALAVSLGVVWFVAHHRLIHPASVLAAETQLVAEAGHDGAIDPLGFRWLGPLPGAINLLAGKFVAARREIDRSVAVATERVEEQKRRLEAILRDLSEGVLVCNLDHQILLYNQVALSLLHVAGDLGLGRSLFNVLTREPVLHALERLSHRPTADGGPESMAIDVVCATIDARSLLHGRMSLVVDATGGPSGYVLTIGDVTREITELGRRDALLRSATEGLRAPLANLRAAAETLAAYPDVEQAQRRAFEEVIRRESDVLSQRLETLDRDARSLTSGDWPMADIHSVDLFNCIIRRLADGGGPQLTMIGLPLWLRGDSHSLVLAIERIVRELGRETGRPSFDIEALLGDRRVYIEVRWDGAPLSSATLDSWLGAPLPGALGAQTLRDVLARHGAEAWSREERPGRSLLRLPLPAPTRVPFDRPKLDLPSRPEFYDFDLLRPGVADPTVLARPLRTFTYVVFDTETTGLSPSQGDEIIAIGAVRIVSGRILTGETFARLVNPGRTIPPDSIRFHGITDNMVADAPPIPVALPQFKTFVGDAVLVAHNAAFDLKFLRMKEAECGVRFDNLVLDTLLLSAFLYQNLDNHDLDAIARRLGVDIAGRHTALGDALATAAVFVRQLDLLEARGIATLESLIRASNMMLEIRARQAHF